jgi:tetratricopeptide (TPR) repeat protein
MHDRRGTTVEEHKPLAEVLNRRDQALAIMPDDAEAALEHGVTLEALGHLAEALASYDRALAIRPDYAEALYRRGNILGELNRPDEALDSYNRALALQPDWVEALNNRGEWVLLLAGAARLRFADETDARHLCPAIGSTSLRNAATGSSGPTWRGIAG